ncbi:MAG: hypothetical protein K9M44_03475 [Candidatus Pacebacteria bacterium]|nr:hypothetical protein [Candidatus Paceibacterota bacterium]
MNKQKKQKDKYVLRLLFVILINLSFLLGGGILLFQLIIPSFAGTGYQEFLGVVLFIFFIFILERINNYLDKKVMNGGKN